MTFIMMLFSLVITYDPEVEKMDVKKTFLYKTFEEIFKEKLEGFSLGGNKLVCKINKSLYGLK